MTINEFRDVPKEIRKEIALFCLRDRETREHIEKLARKLAREQAVNILRHFKL